MKKPLIAIGAVAVAAVAGFVIFGGGADTAQEPVAALDGTALVQITVPEVLSENALIGKRGFDQYCAQCHGPNAVGQDGVAPPLIHKIYEPSHHADESFQRAVAQGVQAHHWTFGNMPPVQGLSRADVALIIAYVRELQQANGIQ